MTIPTGGIFDTPGYYYYIIGGLQGVFIRSYHDIVQGFVEGVETNFFQYGRSNDVMSFVEFREMIETVNATVPLRTVESIRRSGADALRRNVERGVLNISDEELEERVNRIMNAPLHPARIID